jgi:hypothetical protein
MHGLSLEQIIDILNRIKEHQRSMTIGQLRDQLEEIKLSIDSLIDGLCL